MGLGFAPYASNILTRHLPSGTRNLMPCRSPGTLIGRLLLVMCRTPFSHTASTLRPFFSISGSIFGQKISFSMRPMCARSLTMYGISKMPAMSTSELMTVDGNAMSSVPSLSFWIISLSPPSWLEP